VEWPGIPSGYLPVMRTGALVVAVLLLLTGLVWMGQGLGYVKGSFMTGEMRWFWIGLGCVLAAAALMGLRRVLR
jgi:hypothetical protein